jgi:hypothetical protein
MLAQGHSLALGAKKFLVFFIIDARETSSFEERPGGLGSVLGMVFESPGKVESAKAPFQLRIR